ncbi:MAG: glycolate oxidase subunit GlcE [Alphaproteobacteria bacterium]
MAETLTPGDAGQLREAVAWAASGETPLEIVGRGSKRALGRPVQAAHVLDVSKLSGIEMYEPDELVMCARSGTPLAEVETALAANRQRLAFEPPDLGPLLGETAGAASVGGVFACNLAGPRRIAAGGARDHFLGVAAVTGRGEAIKAGGRVVKNVTGYDICKLFAGAYGTLAVMTALTFKVLPAPEKTRTVLVFGLDDARGIEAMTAALASPHEVAAAAHLPATAAARSVVAYVSGAGAAVTAVRVEGPAPSAEHRCRALRELLGGFGAVEELHGLNSGVLWRELRDVAPFVGDDRVVWRLSVPPAAGADVVGRIAGGIEAEAFYDWGGGLVWLAFGNAGDDGGAALVRAAIDGTGGHATLMRADAGLRGALPVFQPQDAALAALTRRVKEGFDPHRVLNPGRMYAGV